MKKLLLFAFVAIMICGCGENMPGAGGGNSALEDSLAALRSENEQLRQETDDLLSTFNEIEEGFRDINEAQGRMTIDRRGEGANARQRIQENMQFIQETMAQNNELIESLRQRLRQTTANAEQLQRTIDNLVAQMEQKNAEIEQLRAELQRSNIQIAQLNQQVSNLNEDISDQQDVIQQQDATISHQDRQLNTAWYAIGTKRELKDNNILGSGGRVLQSGFNESYFTQVDIRQLSQLNLNSRSAEILTTHPASSYSLERGDNRMYVLRILDYRQFWSTSKYLVVKVK
ncbi:MAG: hypothetical protein ACSW8D_11830 [Prevotella sp.]